MSVTVAKVNVAQGTTVVGAVRWLVLASCVVSSSGCATLWTVFEVADVDWKQGSISNSRPLGPEERRLRVSAEYVPPAPVEVVEAPPPLPAPEPWPGDVVVRPEPPPEVAAGRPFPQGALKLKCVEQARFTREEVTETIFRYDGTWKALTGFMFVAEAALSGVLLWASTQHRSGQLDGLPFGIGLGFGLDALGTAILFWHPKQQKTKTWQQDGQWKARSNECTPPLAVSVSTGPFPVEKNGEVPGLGEWMLQHVVDTEETSLELRHGAAVVPWRLEVLEKCELAKKAQSPAPFCRWASGWRSPTEATIPLPVP